MVFKYIPFMVLISCTLLILGILGSQTCANSRHSYLFITCVGVCSLFIESEHYCVCVSSVILSKVIIVGALLWSAPTIVHFSIVLLHLQCNNICVCASV